MNKLFTKQLYKYVRVTFRGRPWITSVLTMFWTRFIAVFTVMIIIAAKMSEKFAASRILEAYPGLAEFRTRLVTSLTKKPG